MAVRGRGRDAAPDGDGLATRSSRSRLAHTSLRSDLGRDGVGPRVRRLPGEGRGRHPDARAARR
eukprot:2395278-Pyramimonas_sp.AAC.1